MKYLNILLWGITIIFFVAIINAIITDKPTCGYDDQYDNNCDLIN
jgi:hypothetical protein